jgi:hypothetical protein
MNTHYPTHTAACKAAKELIRSGYTLDPKSPSGLNIPKGKRPCGALWLEGLNGAWESLQWGRILEAKPHITSVSLTFLARMDEHDTWALIEGLMQHVADGANANAVKRWTAATGLGPETLLATALAVHEGRNMPEPPREWAFALGVFHRNGDRMRLGGCAAWVQYDERGFVTRIEKNEGKGNGWIAFPDTVKWVPLRHIV